MVSDRFHSRWGLKGRVRWLVLARCGEGLAWTLFSQAPVVTWAIPSVRLCGLFVTMSNGATYAVVPFVNRQALGSVAGIVGAGGNRGAVLAGFLFKSSLAWPTALWMLGLGSTAVSGLAFCVQFSGRLTVVSPLRILAFPALGSVL